METLKVWVCVSGQVAIRAQYGRVGSEAWPLVGVLPLLSDEDREQLAACWHNGKLRVGSFEREIDLQQPPSDVMVAAAIAIVFAEQRQRAADEAAAREAVIVKAIALPDADWIGGSGSGPRYYESNDALAAVGTTPRYMPCVHSVPRGVYLSDEQRSDPRIIAHRAEVEARALPAAIAAWQERYDQWCELARLEKDRDELEVRRQQSVQAEVRAWAANCEMFSPQLRRAAKEGRDVQSAVITAINALVRVEVCSVLGEVGCGTLGDTYGESSDDRVPSERAYMIRDALVSAIGRIASGATVPDATVTISDFKRMDVSPGKARVWRCGVHVGVECAWFPKHDFGCNVLCEDYTAPSDDEDNE